MNTRIIKKIVHGLPVAGDELIKIENGCAIYKSGGKIQIDNSTRLEVGDIVIGVYHGSDDNEKIIVNIDHKTGNTITNDSYSKEYLKIERIFKLKEILK
jgi:hypothetical protein